ncbi:hypothetical protein CEP53_004657 [Fusarium sp. AF-6]|nr:hypothetical protein CEP53_004657 [Fusarium sp. AF-6]
MGLLPLSLSQLSVFLSLRRRRPKSPSPSQPARPRPPTAKKTLQSLFNFSFGDHHKKNEGGRLKTKRITISSPNLGI